MNWATAAQYCGACLCRLPGDAEHCIECGAAACGLNYRQAQEHLLAMLRGEDSADCRNRAISAFGQRGEPDRAEALVDIAFATSVGSPEALAIVRCLEHLLSLGHTRIGFAAGDDYLRPTCEKAEGWETALRAAGIAPSSLVAHTSFTFEGGRAAFRELVAHRDGPPTGIFCSNDLMAIGVIREAEAHGVDVPGDLSVVGFDGIDAAFWNAPTLTTVEQPIDEIAETAVEALLTLIAGRAQTLPNYVFRPRLRVGGSTAPLAL